MGKYSGVLLCSDFDGTLNFNGICEENVRAIRKFQEEGGRFTLCTGRDGEQFSARTRLPFPLNAPMIGLTGAELYDTTQKRRVEGNFMESDWLDLLEEMVEKIPCLQSFEVVGEDFLTTFECSDRGAFRHLREKAAGASVFKTGGFYLPTGPELCLPAAEEICRGKCHVTSNGPGSFELTHTGIHKGYGALRCKELTGAKFLICVGDYAGDIDMFRVADLSYADENAAQEVKNVADRVTIHAKDGAIAKIIEEIALL